MNSDSPQTPIEKANNYIAKNNLLFGIIVFILALSLRLAYLNQMDQGIYYNLLKMEGTDCFRFIKWSFTLTEEGWLAGIDFPKSALYSYFLSAIFKIFGTKVYVARIIQMLMGSLTCLMVFTIGKRAFSPLAGLIAGIIAASYAPMIFYDGAILRANMITFLNTLLILLMLTCQDRLTMARAVLLGIVHGLCILAKPNIIIFIPGIIIWLWLVAEKFGTRKTLVAACIMAVGTLMPLSIMFARNTALELPALSLTKKGPIEFISGNVPQSPGIGWVVPESAQEMVKRADGKMTGVIREVLKENRSHPMGLIRQQFRKLGALLNAYEIANNVSIYVEKRYVPFMRLPWPEFSLVLALGLIGLAAGLKKWRKLFPLYSYIILYSIATVAFYILSRFRLPIVSVLTVFSGAAIVIILENILDRKRLRALAIIAPAALVFALSRPGQPDPLQMSDYHNMARYHIISGQPEKAPEIWNQGMTRARKILEQKPSAQAHFRVALFLYKTGGDPAEALDHLKNAQGMNPPIYLQTPINNLKKSIQNPALINR